MDRFFPRKGSGRQRGKVESFSKVRHQIFVRYQKLMYLRMNLTALMCYEVGMTLLYKISTDQDPPSVSYFKY